MSTPITHDDPQTRALHVAMSITDAYLLPALVTLRSFVARLSDNTRPVLHLVHRNLSDRALQLISDTIVTRSYQTDFGELGALCRHVHFPPEAAAPILLADLLPDDIRRVVFLDADLLVLDDLTPLADLDLKGHALAAAQDWAIPTLSSPRGVKAVQHWGCTPDAPYFNAGLLVLDLDRWRQMAPLPDLYRYMRDTGAAADQFHQEALNAVFCQRWTRLDDRWNLIGSLYGRPFGPMKGMHCAAPAVIHFSGRIKPWRSDVASPFNSTYQTELRSALDYMGPDLSADISADRQTVKDQAIRAYDTYARSFLYPLETFLWKRRLI